MAFLVDEMRKARALERLTFLRRQEKEEMSKVVEEEARKRVEEGVACRLVFFGNRFCKHYYYM